MDHADPYVMFPEEFNARTNEIHQIAVEHGWWPEDRPIEEIVALIHSEVSEALEDYRNNKGLTETWEGAGGKPEGIPIELADIVIRCHDALGHKGIFVNRPVGCKWRDNQNFAVALGRLHRDISDILHHGSWYWLVEVISHTWGVCRDFGIDLWAAVDRKVAFNRSRPFRHGNKKA